MVYRTTINASAFSNQSNSFTLDAEVCTKGARRENLLEEIRARKKTWRKGVTKGNKQRPSEFSSVRTEPSHRWIQPLLKDYKQAVEGIDGG